MGVPVSANSPLYQMVDGQAYLSISHWGMFPVSTSTILDLLKETKHG